MLDNDLVSVLRQIAHGLAAQFGSDCEVVLHDLTAESAEHTIVLIENGHVSNRKIGDGPSHIVLEAMHSGAPEDKLAYLTRTQSGRVLKSSTMFIRDRQDQVCAVLAINYDISSFLALSSSIGFLTATSNSAEGGQSEPEHIPLNVSDLLDELAEQAVRMVGKPVVMMTKEDKVRVVRYLSDSGAFLITKSGDRISKLLGISKYPLYSDLDEGKD